MPARLRDLIRAATALGAEVDMPSSGSHWKFRRGGEMYPVPASHGMNQEISDRYIRAMCRRLGLDEQDLRSRL